MLRRGGLDQGRARGHEHTRDSPFLRPWHRSEDRGTGVGGNENAPPEGTTTVTNEDGSTTTTTVVYNDDGTYTTTTSTSWPNGTVDTTVSTDSRVNETGGAVDDDGKIGGPVAVSSGAPGRINWRELVR